MRTIRQLLAFTALGFVWGVAMFGGSFIVGLVCRSASIAFNFGYSLIP